MQTAISGKYISAKEQATKENKPVACWSLTAGQPCRTRLGLKPSPGAARCTQERGRAQRPAGQGRPRSPRVTEAFPPMSLPGTTLRSSHSFESAIREVPAPKAIPGHREPPPPDPRGRSLDAPPHSPRHILCEAPSRDGMHCSAVVCFPSDLSQWTVSSAG